MQAVLNLEDVQIKQTHAFNRVLKLYTWSLCGLYLHANFTTHELWRKSLTIRSKTFCMAGTTSITNLVCQKHDSATKYDDKLQQYIQRSDRTTASGLLETTDRTIASGRLSWRPTVTGMMADVWSWPYHQSLDTLACSSSVENGGSIMKLLAQSLAKS